MRPSVASPTGTVIGAPVSVTAASAGEAVRGVHRDRADAVVAEVLLHLRDQIGLLAAVLGGNLDLQRAVDRGKRAGEDGVDDDAFDLDDVTDVRVLLGHSGSWLGVGGEVYPTGNPGRAKSARKTGAKPPAPKLPGLAAVLGRD